MPNQSDSLPWHMQDALEKLARSRGRRGGDYLPRLRKRADYLEVYQGRGGVWRWRHRAGNHQIISQGEGYTRRYSAVRGAIRANPGVCVKA